MEIRANFKELEAVSNNINSNSELLDEQINIIGTIVSSLKNNWEGDAANIFYSNVSSYSEKLKTVPICHRNFSSVINFMNNNYQTLDEEYANALKGSVIEHE